MKRGVHNDMDKHYFTPFPWNYQYQHGSANPQPFEQRSFNETDQYWQNTSATATGGWSCSPSPSPSIASSHSLESLEESTLLQAEPSPQGLRPPQVQNSSKGKRQRTTYNKWTDEEEKLLVQLWAEKYPKLESKDARKAWQEIVSEINAKFESNKKQEKCTKKMQYLISKYKEARDWNRNQTGGDRKSSPYYNEIDEILGCRDVMTFRHVIESGAAAKEEDNEDDSSAGTSEEGPATPLSAKQKRTERKLERKRPRKSETVKDAAAEETELLKSVVADMKEERAESKEFMQKFSELQSKQLDTMNTFLAAITQHLTQNQK